MPLPGPFAEQMEQQLGSDFQAFLLALESPAPVSIRYNPRKLFKLPENLEKVKWFSGGVYLQERPLFTLDPLFHAGAYYVQEASSMFVAEAVRQLISPGEALRALDLAAAPGGKSTLLIDILPEGSWLLANEVIRGRYQVLQENLTRWGHPAAYASNHDPRDFKGLEGFFDLLLIDAPCSGEGLFRKSPEAALEWSPSAVSLCAARQQRILADALPLVRPGGVLLYSTCTYNSLENEDNAAWIARHADFEPAVLDLPAHWGIVQKDYGYQFYPHRLKGEGFYLAAFRRLDGPGAQQKYPGQPFRALTRLPRQQRDALAPWLREPESQVYFQKPDGGILAILADHVDDAQFLSARLARLQTGTRMGAFKGRDFIPDHALALSTLVSQSLPALSLSREQALQYLKKEIPNGSSIPQGWALAQYEAINLGWLKGLQNRLNNYLPKEWRIRMDVWRDGGAGG